MKSSLFFRVALVLNGIGSCGLAFAFPFYLAADSETGFMYYFLQVIVFSAAAFGMLYWGHKLDHSKDIWKFKLRIAVLELLITIIFIAAVLLEFSNIGITIVIAILEFLFTFEIPWSRIAYYELPVNREKDRGKLSREIILATTFILILAPTFGAFFGSLKNLFVLSIINFVSFVPYCVISYMLAGVGMKTGKSGDHDTEEDTAAAAISFTRFLGRIKKESELLQSISGLSILYFGLSVIIVTMPFLLYTDLSAMGSWAIPLFFVITGLISVIFNSGKVRDKLPKIFFTSFTVPSVGLFFSGLIFFLVDNFVVKTLFYCVYSILWIGINIYITDLIYKEEYKAIRGRLFSLIQFFARFTTPLVSAALAFIPRSHDPVVISAIFGGFSILGIFLFMAGDIKKMLARLKKQKEAGNGAAG